MPTDRSLARWRSRKGLRIAALLAGVSLSAVAAHAQDATWQRNGTGNFNTATNWEIGVVPTGTAFFGVSFQNAVSFSPGTTNIGGWTFNPGASNYTFTISQTGVFVQFLGAGIVINGGSVTILQPAEAGALAFAGSSTAANATIISSGQLVFAQNSTAGNATITTNRSHQFGGTFFNGSGTGGTARFITNAGGVFDMSGLTSGGMTAGSIEGAGSYYLGANRLTVGGNTNVSGVISDCGPTGTDVPTGVPAGARSPWSATARWYSQASTPIPAPLLSTAAS